MADIALAMAALGGLYIVSNRDDKICKEGFDEKNQSRGTTYQKVIANPYTLSTLANKKSQVSDGISHINGINKHNSC